MGTVDVSRILVVAATARELAEADGWRRLCCGVGPVDAAAVTGAEVADAPPAAILHVGIAGAAARPRRGSPVIRWRLAGDKRRDAAPRVFIWSSASSGRGCALVGAGGGVERFVQRVTAMK